MNSPVRSVVVMGTNYIIVQHVVMNVSRVWCPDSIAPCYHQLRATSRAPISYFQFPAMRATPNLTLSPRLLRGATRAHKAI